MITLNSSGHQVLQQLTSIASGQWKMETGSVKMGHTLTLRGARPVFPGTRSSRCGFKCTSRARRGIERRSIGLSRPFDCTWNAVGMQNMVGFFWRSTLAGGKKWAGPIQRRSCGGHTSKHSTQQFYATSFARRAGVLNGMRKCAAGALITFRSRTSANGVKNSLAKGGKSPTRSFCQSRTRSIYLAV